MRDRRVWLLWQCYEECFINTQLVPGQLLKQVEAHRVVDITQLKNLIVKGVNLIFSSRIFVIGEVKSNLASGRLVPHTVSSTLVGYLPSFSSINIRPFVLPSLCG